MRDVIPADIVNLCQLRLKPLTSYFYSAVIVRSVYTLLLSFSSLIHFHKLFILPLNPEYHSKSIE
jgi:hypothetical protein